jgi:hypothetical protein
MNLETTRLHCERMIEMRRGAERFWSSEQMLDVVTDLQRMLENARTNPHLLSQMRRMNEELDAMYAENQRLMAGKPWVTYRMEDGSDIYGEYAWVTDTEFFEESDECRVIKETWRLVDSEVVVFNEWIDDEDDDDLPPGVTLPVQNVTSDLLSGGPGLSDSVRNHPAGGPLDSRPDAQSGEVEGRPDVPRLRGL